MPEKTINEISADARRLYSQATEAARRDNTDYAITLYCEVLKKEPGFLDCRRQLRAQQVKKAGATTTGFFKKMMTGAGSSPLIAKAKMSVGKNPAEAMATAEEILSNDPNSTAALRIIVDAAHGLDLPLTAVFALETMVKASPKDKALVIEYAGALAENGGDVTHGERVLQDLLRAGYDGDLSQALKNLSARSTMDKGGYSQVESGKASFRDILRNKDEAVRLEQEARVVKSENVADRLIGEYEARLKTEPNNLKITRELAKLYAEKNQFAESLAVYERLKGSDMGNDPTLDAAIAVTTVKQFDYQISQLNTFAPDYAEQLANLQAAKLNFQVTDCQKRVEKYPTDLAIRFEMGVFYLQTGKVSEAIAEFQKAQQNPHKRLSAMNYLAQCYVKRKMYDFAVRTLQNAIKEKPVFDEEKKEMVYNLGCALEAMGKKEEAIEQFKQIYEMDISYKDVSAKVDAYYASQ